MVVGSTALEEIAQLQGQIFALKEAAVVELKERRSRLEAELASIDKELETLTGKAAGAPRVRQSTPAAPRRSLPLQELKEFLAAAPDRTLNIRKEGLDLANIKTLAKANPHLLRLGGKAPWPTVTLLSAPQI